MYVDEFPPGSELDKLQQNINKLSFMKLQLPETYHEQIDAAIIELNLEQAQIIWNTKEKKDKARQNAQKQYWNR